MSFSFRKRIVGATEVSFLVCDPLEKAGFIHAFGTRQCGADDPGLLLSAMKAMEWNLTMARQTHSDTRLFLEENPLLEGDALITQKEKVFAGIKTADCVSLLIGDPATGTSVAIHAGWRGTLQRITQKTLGDLRHKMNVNPENCVAAIGPSACGTCYEVGPDVIQQFKAEFGDGTECLDNFSSDGKATLDTSLANRQQLLAAGLKPENIHTAPCCTMHQNESFYSHRKENKTNPHVGRQLSVIGKKINE